ncbi:MAG: metallophosphoesterase [Caldilineaceae bacterium]|nr:metallophosphoesterase [Caldilineaceae bacterium]
MELYAISDLHLSYAENRAALLAMPAYPDDWLILAGDVGETAEHLRLALAALTRRFARVLWVPGNHDLWTMPNRPDEPRGVAKYQQLVDLCRSYRVLTPEDPYVAWPGAGGPCLLAPLFLLYDYSFRPDEIPAEAALAWAEEEGIVCADELLLHPTPYATRADWCAARCAYTAARLAAVAGTPLILINHFPLRQDLAVLPRIPRFSLWCGTRRTEDWHLRFAAQAVIYGHLHIPGTRWRDGVRFEEVSFGYPKQRPAAQPIERYLRKILPA